MPRIKSTIQLKLMLLAIKLIQVFSLNPKNPIFAPSSFALLLLTADSSPNSPGELSPTACCHLQTFQLVFTTIVGAHFSSSSNFSCTQPSLFLCYSPPWLPNSLVADAHLSDILRNPITIHIPLMYLQLDSAYLR